MTGRPSSVEEASRKEMYWFAALQLTVRFPDRGETIYPDTEATPNENSPLGTAKVIVSVVEFWVAPPSVTDHVVPIGSPLSLNVTAYLIAVKEIVTCTGVPFTVTDPEDGDKV